MFRTSLVILIFILITILGCRFHSFYQDKPIYQDGQYLRLEVVLQEEPDFSNKGQKFAVSDAFNQTIYVTADAFPRLHYGQVLVIEGKLQQKDLEDGRRLFSLYMPQLEIKSNSSSLVAGWANAIREQSKSVYERTLPPTAASLLMGIVFGAKEHFPDSFFDALKTTGVLHVIAASGMNVTFIAAALLFGLRYFMRRQIALIVGALGIIFYVFLVGFEPSIIRAAIMGVLAFGAGLLGKQHIAAFAVLVSGYVMLLFQPGFLFDVGFQLSFMATLGIIFIKPLLPLPQNFFAETISTTLAAQLGTLPILLSVFGKFGLLSLLVNALVLWVVPIVMLLGSLAAILGFVFVPFSQMLLLLSLPFLQFFEAVVSFFGTSGWVMTLPKLPMFIWLGYYFIAAAIVVMREPKLQSDPNRSLLSDL